MSLKRFKNKINILYETSPKESKEQQQAMSLCAMLSWGNDFPVNTLKISGIFYPEDSKKGLAHSWDIYDTKSAKDSLNCLLTEGRRTKWDKILKNVKKIIVI